MTVDGSFTVFNEVQLEKAFSGISVILELDKSMLSNEEQSAKAYIPIVFSPLPLSANVTFFRLLAFQNAPLFTLSILDGKDKELILVSL